MKLRTKLILVSFLLFASAGICYFLWDQSVACFFAARENSYSYRIARELTDVGLGAIWFSVAFFFWIFGYLMLKKNRSPQKAEIFKSLGRNLFLSIIVSGIALRILKFVIGRQRPHKSITCDAYVFDPFTHDWHMQSMPSGHSQVLFASMITFALFFPKWRWMFYTLGLGLAFTRVMTMQHFLSDIFVGCCLGLWGAYYVHNHFNKKV